MGDIPEVSAGLACALAFWPLLRMPTIEFWRFAMASCLEKSWKKFFFAAGPLLEATSPLFSAVAGYIFSGSVSS